MTDSAKKKTGPLSVVAKLSGRSLGDVYRLFRLPDAPQPVEHVACVPAYDLEAAIAWVTPPSEPGSDPLEPRSPIPPRLATVPQRGNAAVCGVVFLDSIEDTPRTCQRHPNHEGSHRVKPDA